MRCANVLNGNVNGINSFVGLRINFCFYYLLYKSNPLSRVPSKVKFITITVYLYEITSQKIN